MLEKRMHPMKIFQSFIQMIKNSAIIILYLFIIKWNDDSVITFYARIGFILLVIIYLIALIINWWKTRYVFTEHVIHVKRGLFKKKHHEIRLERIQNIQRETPFYFKMFQVTALTLNTKGTDDHASITFEAVKVDEAEQIEQLLADYRQKHRIQPDAQGTESLETSQAVEQLKVDDDNVDPDIVAQQSHSEEVNNHTKEATPKTVHFRPTKKDLFKASFLSLSFLIIIPIALTGYEKIKDVMEIEQYTEGLFQFITQSWLTITLTAIVLALIASLIGVAKTYLTYGKYEIASDDAYILIRSGLLNEKSLSIRKGNVQAIRVHQSLLKRWLNMSEIILISTGGEEDDLDDTQSLFPFLPTERAFSLSNELLPAFQVQTDLHRLPRRALFMRMLRIPWLFLIAVGAIFIFKPTWWFVLPVLLIATYAIRYFDYRNTSYGMDSGGIQFKSGGFDSVSFITTRKDVIEIAVKQSLIQRKLGLATIQTINQATPVHEEEIKDVPIVVANQFMAWYGERFNDVEVE